MLFLGEQVGRSASDWWPQVDLASGERVIFAATGVTEGILMKGVRFFGEGARTSSLVMQSNPHRVQFVDTIHVSSTAGEAALLRF